MFKYLPLDAGSATQKSWRGLGSEAMTEESIVITKENNRKIRKESIMIYLSIYLSGLEVFRDGLMVFIGNWGKSGSFLGELSWTNQNVEYVIVSWKMRSVQLECKNNSKSN